MTIKTRLLAIAVLALFLCCPGMAQTQKDSTLHYPVAGTFMLVNYYLEPTGYKLPINYHQYKVHNGDEAGILCIFDKYYMNRTNGFNCFESYAQNATMIEWKHDNNTSYHRFVGENDSIFFRSTINSPMIVSKKHSRLVTLEAAKGQGRIISDYGDIPVRAKKDTTSAVLMMLRDDRGKNYGSSNPVKCLGVEGDWYHVKYEIYGERPIEGYVEKYKAVWIPKYYGIFY